MKAIIQTDPSDRFALHWQDTDTPTIGENEVLVKVAASSVNRADLLQAQGHYPPPPGASEIIGLECSGTIAEVGAGVDNLEVGDEVCAIVSGGGYAEYVAVPAGQCLPLPAGMGLIESAGVLEVTATVWSNIVLQAGLKEGDVFLVHGGAGGIGTTAIQIAKALGATVLTTAGTQEKMDFCVELGADRAIKYREEDFVEIVKEYGGADVILDNMGAKYLDRNISALAADGRLVIIGMQGGVKGELNIGRLLSKRGSIAAISLRGRPAEGPAGKAHIVQETGTHVWPMIEQGALRLIIDRVVDMRETSAAHRALAEGTITGKIILTVPASD